MNREHLYALSVFCFLMFGMMGIPAFRFFCVPLNPSSLECLLKMPDWYWFASEAMLVSSIAFGVLGLMLPSIVRIKKRLLGTVLSY